MIFYIDGEVPSKKNSRINTRTGKSFPSKRYQEWHDVARLQILLQMRKQNISSPIDYASKVSITFVHGDLVRRDSDNATSSILDLLKDCKVIADDNWKIVRELHIRNGFVKGKSRCKVEIEKILEV